MPKLSELMNQLQILEVKIEAARKLETLESVPSSEKVDKDGHFANYSEYSKTLRSWLVAYGIGGPVLFLTNKDAPAKLASSPDLKIIVTLFLAGVVFQILLAFINKWAAWHLYKATIHHNYDQTCIYRFWLCINNQSWIDFFVDLGTLCSFTIATWIVLNILIGIA
jgi:hypothetical protein